MVRRPPPPPENGRALAGGTRAAVRRAARWLGRTLRLRKPPPPTAGETIKRLERALFGGLSRYALPELMRLAADPGVDEAARIAAFETLAARRLETSDPGAALAHLRAAPSRAAGPHARRLATLEVEALLRLARAEEAATALAHLRELAGETPDYWFARANLLAIDDAGGARSMAAERLAALNAPLVAAGAAALSLNEEAEGPLLARIAAEAAPIAAAGAPKISVLVPVYDAEDTVAFALDSLLRQTWSNVEAVVVDDASTDNSWQVISAIAARDARVVALRHERNRGAYPAMNTALVRATGDFVCTHGADDWSHPEKLARQVRPMLDGDAPCTVSWAIRVQPDLRVELRPRTASHLAPNVSSLLFRREELDLLGGWDEVRADADAEIYARYRARFRRERVDVLAAAPLSLVSARPQSLTKSSAIGVGSIGFGARRQYREAYSHWHRLEAQRPVPDLRLASGRRAFPAPRPLLRRDEGTRALDVLFVSDFAEGGPLAALNLAQLEAAAALGLAAAFFHWPRPLSAGRPVDRKLRSYMQEACVDTLVAGESARCRLVVVTCADALECFPDAMPEIAGDAAFVRAERGSADPSRLPLLVEGAMQAFGVAPEFVPADAAVRRKLRALDGRVRVANEDWKAAFPSRPAAASGALARLAAAKAAAGR
jgi:hypothetical protein